MGNGYFAKELAYKDWFEFNSWQRVHANFLEGLWLYLGDTYVALLYEPLFAAIFTFLYLIGRIIYSIGYCRAPGSRVIGALFREVC